MANLQYNIVIFLNNTPKLILKNETLNYLKICSKNAGAQKQFGNFYSRSSVTLKIKSSRHLKFPKLNLFTLVQTKSTEKIASFTVKMMRKKIINFISHKRWNIIKHEKENNFDVSLNES